MGDLRRLARVAADVFGTTPRVHRYYDDSGAMSVDVLACRESPDPGLTSFASLGLSDFDTGSRLDDLDLRVEFVAAARSEFDLVGNAVAGCAFNVGLGEYQAGPRFVYPSVFAGYGREVTTPHALLWFPFVWESPFEPVISETEQVEWLCLIPVTEDEFAFVAQSGADDLIDCLERTGADIFDLRRPSCLDGGEPARGR